MDINILLLDFYIKKSYAFCGLHSLLDDMGDATFFDLPSWYWPKPETLGHCDGSPRYGVGFDIKTPWVWLLVCALDKRLGLPEHIVSKKSKSDIAVSNRNHHTTTGNHMPYGITQCYLPSLSLIHI